MTVIPKVDRELCAIGPITTENFIAIAKWQIIPPHWRPPTTAGRKLSGSASVNQLGMFCTALIDVFSQKASTDCSGERRAQGEHRHVQRRQPEHVLDKDVFV